MQLRRILAGDGFKRSERICRFLSYAVERTLQGHGDELKESVLAVEVYDRPPDYNPKIDPIVRNDARRLRAKLSEYYETEGSSDPIIIEIPKGSYLPVFREREGLPHEAGESGWGIRKALNLLDVRRTIVSRKLRLILCEKEHATARKDRSHP